MTTLAVTYLVVWFAVVLYVARLGVRQSQLRRKVRTIQTQIASKATEIPSSRAA